jgi:hypothetical protein|nr:MAG TPA: protein of unknown function (DUF4969) [Caudoviricetes sp.]
MKKRFLSMILAVVLCGLLLAGCDGGGSTGTVPPAPEAPAVSAGVVSIKLLGASWEKKMDGYTYVYYSAELSNRNSKTAGACQITVTSRDAEGHVLDVSNGYTGRIAGNDTIRFSGGVMYVGDVPSAVELAVGNPMGGYNDHFDATAKASDFQFKNVARLDESKISGDVVNNSSVDCTNVRVSVILKKNGQVIGGTYTYANNVKGNGGSAPFVIYSFVDYDSFEVVAAEW